MLFTSKFAALIAAFAIGPGGGRNALPYLLSSPPAPQNDDPSLALPPPAVEAARIVPKLELVGEVDYEDAVDHFFAMMREEVAGGWVRVRHVKASYDQLRGSFGWPDMSTKALSQALVERGCERKKIEERRHGGGRPTVLAFPRFSQRKEKPMKLAS